MSTSYQGCNHPPCSSELLPSDRDERDRLVHSLLDYWTAETKSMPGGSSSCYRIGHHTSYINNQAVGEVLGLKQALEHNVNPPSLYGASTPHDVQVSYTKLITLYP
ncbi:unnamed protein product, partial [Chrysoparadoxa australica]